MGTAAHWVPRKTPCTWGAPVKLAAVQAYRNSQGEESLGDQKPPPCSAAAGGANRSFG